jgi:organic hydroperoxide reductase OsmC/OhrA
MNMLDSYVYSAELDWVQGRSGTLRSGIFPKVEFSAPPEFSGEPGKWTPEHLLAAAVVSCYTATFMAIAELHKLTVHAFHVNAFARLEKVPGEGYRFTEFTLVPEIHVNHDEVETALKVVAKAEKNCFVAKSLKATMQVEPKFVPVGEQVAV